MDESNNEMFTVEDKQTLLKIARIAIRTHLSGQPLPEFSVSKNLKLKGGAFVTLRRAGELRGCIGYLTGNKPLYQTVAELAVASATRDYRFSPVIYTELDEIKIEISVLTPLRKIKNISEIEVGRHGICIEAENRRGVLLPQVAVEWGWDREQFLEAVCRKTGLQNDCWQQKNVNIYIFSAYILKEEK